MSRTIAALFDDPGRAEGALQALMTAGLAGRRTSLLRGEAHGTEMAPFRDASRSDAPHLVTVPAEDRALFEEGVRRGGCVLVADVAGDVDEAMRIIETFDPADLDRRAEEWRGRNAAREPQGGVDIGAPLGAGLTAGMGQGNTNLELMPGAGAMADDPSTLGTADLRTTEMSAGNEGRSTVAVGDRRSEERAGAPGVLELGPASSLGRVRLYGAG